MPCKDILLLSCSVVWTLIIYFFCRDRSPSPGGSERDLPGAPHDRDLSARSDISADSIERNGGGGAVGMEGQQRFERSQARFLDELRSRGAKIVQVTYPRTANNDKELTVIRGEYLEVSELCYF
jgi:epidermal growth factor receptor kinase substrate 8